MPSPSASTIHFVPLPRLVFPTARPPFWRVRNCRLRNSHPSAAGRFHPAPPTGCARLPAKSLALASVAAAARRSRARETRPEEIATPLPSAESRECPPDGRRWLLVADRDYLLAARAGESRAELPHTAHRTHAEENCYKGESWQSPDTVPMTDEQMKEMKWKRQPDEQAILRNSSVFG